MKSITKFLLINLLGISLVCVELGYAIPFGIDKLIQPKKEETIEIPIANEDLISARPTAYTALSASFIPQVKATITKYKISPEDESMACEPIEEDFDALAKSANALDNIFKQSHNCTSFYDGVPLKSDIPPTTQEIRDKKPFADLFDSTGTFSTLFKRDHFGASTAENPVQRSKDFCKCISSKMIFKSRMTKDDVIRLERKIDKYIENSQQKLQADMFYNLVDGLQKTLRALHAEVGPQRCSPAALRDIYSTQNCPAMKESLSFASKSPQIRELYQLDRFPIGLFDSVKKRTDDLFSDYSIDESINAITPIIKKIVNRKLKTPELPTSSEESKVSYVELENLSAQIIANPKLSSYKIKLSINDLNEQDRERILNELSKEEQSAIAANRRGDYIFINLSNGKRFATEDLALDINDPKSGDQKGSVTLNDAIDEWSKRTVSFQGDIQISTACFNQRVLLKNICEGVGEKQLKALAFGNINILANLFESNEPLMPSDRINQYSALQCIRSGEEMNTFVTPEALAYLRDKDSGFFPTTEDFIRSGSNFATGEHIVDQSYKDFSGFGIDIGEEADAEEHVAEQLEHLVGDAKDSFIATNRVRKNRGLPPIEGPAITSSRSTEKKDFTSPTYSLPSTGQAPTTDAPIQETVTPQTQLLQLPAISAQASREIEEEMTELKEEVKGKDIDTKISSYEDRLSDLLKELDSKEAKKAAKVNVPMEEEEETEEELSEMAKLTNHISKLKDEIKTLKKEKSVTTQQQAQSVKPSTSETTPFTLGGGVSQGTTDRAPVSAPTTPTYSPTTGTAGSSPTSTASKDSFTPITSDSKTSSGLTLKGQTIESYNPVEIPLAQFDTNNQAYIEDLYERTNGRPVVVTRINDKGELENVLYEAVKGKNGKIKYVEKKVEKKKKSKSTSKEKKKEERPKRKRLTAEELKQLIEDKTK